MSFRSYGTGLWVGPFWAMVVGVAGCGFDRAPLLPAKGDQVSAVTPAENNAGTPAAGSLNGGPNQAPARDSGTAPEPSDEPQDPPDLVIEPTPDAATDAGSGSNPPPGTDAAPEADASTPPAPKPGLFASCADDSDCGEGLRCYGSGPGYCGDFCEQSSDCTDHGGIDFTCSTDANACRVDCGQSGSDGACPAPLTCIESSGSFRCRLPPTNGMGDRQRFEPCDLSHGNDDCVAGLTCYRSVDSMIDGPGYCAESCTLFPPSGCENPIGGGTQLACNGSVCRFTCSSSVPCPSGMECEIVDQGCHVPPTP